MRTWLQTEVDISTNSLRVIIAAWLNASQRSQNSVGMNRSARGVKQYEQSQGVDTALYKNVLLMLTSIGNMFVMSILKLVCVSAGGGATIQHFAAPRDTGILWHKTQRQHCDNRRSSQPP